MRRTRKAPQARSDNARTRETEPRPHVAEWVVGAVSAGLVAAMVGYLAFIALDRATSLPALHVVTESIAEAGHGFRVAFRIVNRGNRTAAGVIVRGQLLDGDRVVESSEVTIDYVPAHSVHRGGLLFGDDPRQSRLDLAAIGYSDP